MSDDAFAALDRDKIGQIGEMRRKSHRVGVVMRIQASKP